MTPDQEMAQMVKDMWQHAEAGIDRDGPAGVELLVMQEAKERGVCLRSVLLGMKFGAAFEHVRLKKAQ